MATNLETLISLVFSRKPLWDQKVKQYRNRVIVDKLWREVATEFGDITTEEAKKKWKSLRDHFRKELGKVPEPRSGDEAPLNYETYTCWPYFESMLFLKDQMRPRKSGGNIQIGGTEAIDGGDTQPDTAEYSSNDQNEPTEISDAADIDGVDENVQQPPRRTGKRGTQQQLIDIEAKKLKLLEKKVRKVVTADDEDEAFFKSLLPHVRKLQPEEKMLFHMQVQTVVQKFVYQKNKSLTDPNQSIDVFGASSSLDTVPYQHSTPMRPRNEIVDHVLRTPLSSGGPRYRGSPHFWSEVELGAIAYQDEPIDTSPHRSTIISSARQYYTVITSPISSAATQ